MFSLRILAIIATVALLWAQDAVELRESANRKLAARDFDGAIADYERALNALPAGPDSVEAADLLLQMQRPIYSKGDYADARARAQRALEIYRRAHGAEHPSVARALDAIGLTYVGGGEYQGATPYFEQALAIETKTLGPEDHDTVATMERFAVNLNRAGQYARSKVMLEQALAIAEPKFGAKDPLTRDTLAALGQLLVEMGDYPTSLQYQRRALSLREQMSGKDSVDVGDTLIGMGSNARNAKDFVNAKAFDERAVAIYEKALGAENTRVGGALDNLGQVLTEMKHYTEARPVLERALAIQTKALGPRHPWTANVIQGLGLLEFGLGNYQKSREYFLQNLSIWQEALGPEHPFTVASMSEYSDVLAHMGNYQESLDEALRAAEIRRDNIVRTVRTVDERQALQYAALHNTSMDTALTIASRPEATAADRERTWDGLIRGRALVLDEMGARHRSIRQTGDAEVAALERRVEAARNQITKLVLRGPGKLALAEYNTQLEAARREWQTAGTQLAVQSATFRQEWTQERAGYTDVKAALPAGSALVAFRRYRRKNYESPGDSTADSYLAFVQAGPTATPAVVRLGSATQIEMLVTKWRAEIDRERNALGRAATANEAQYRTAAAALRQAVWDPIQRRLGMAARVYIVPDGALQLVNFAALPSSDGRYLVESGPLLHMLSAERDLASPASLPSGTDLLLVADPQFQAKVADGPAATWRGTSSTCPDFAAMQFGRLPGSMAEAQAIARIWSGQGWRETTLSGSGATERALRESAAGKRVVHIATHGFFLNAQCPGNAVSRENPLLRSGLALAGANHRQEAGAHDDDGILTAEEAAALPLENTEWVVLSGCDTGTGDVKEGEGVLGLRRAFQEAGARTLIASLWPVDDAAARQWMGTLYRVRFHDGKSTAEAVRQADLSELRARRKQGASTHPFYWAGFLATGDWR